MALLGLLIITIGLFALSPAVGFVWIGFLLLCIWSES